MTTYIGVPVTTDPATLEQLAIDYLQQQIPGWVPHAGNLETIMIQAIARIASVLMNLASAVPTSVFRAFGPLLGVDPIDATQATVPTTWTTIDTTGYTIPAGTLAAIPDGVGNLVAFQTLTDTTIPAGSSVTAAGAVLMQAVAAGAGGSGLGAPAAAMSLVTPLAYVASIAQTAISTGGVDAEDDAVYLNRLRGELQLLTPRPIVPPDFAALAQEIAGIDRALAIDLYVPAVNELQHVDVDATAGTFTLTFTGQTTAAIAYNASAATVQAALEALSNIAPGDVAVTGGPLPGAPLTVEFKGVYAGTNVAQMTADSTSLTGGTHTTTVTTTTAGAAAQTTAARSVTVAVVDANGNPPTGLSIAAVQALLEAEREVNFQVAVIAPTYTGVDVSFTVTIDDGFDSADVITRAEAAISDFLSPAKWGLPATGDQRAWLDEPTVRYNDLAWVLRTVQGVHHVTVLQLALHGGALGTTDVTLAGPAALPTPQTITGTAA